MKSFRQFFAYSVVGAVGTLAHYLTLMSLVEFLGFQPTIATTVGFIIGAIINYSLNYKFTFRSQKDHVSTFLKFFSVAIVGGIVNTLIMMLGTAMVAINYIFIQFFATGIVLILNFLINKYWTFAQTKTNQ